MDLLALMLDRHGEKHMSMMNTSVTEKMLTYADCRLLPLD
jgi:hypothetical protein